MLAISPQTPHYFDSTMKARYGCRISGPDARWCWNSAPLPDRIVRRRVLCWCEAADRHPDTAWVFIYTREAHPGELVGAHESIEAKVATARLLRDEAGIRRQILVDDLEGTAHHAYGLVPNMSWVIDRGGLIVYKSDWTSTANVDAFLNRYESGRSRRSEAGTVGPYLTEQVESEISSERLSTDASTATDRAPTRSSNGPRKSGAIGHEHPSARLTRATSKILPSKPRPITEARQPPTTRTTPCLPFLAWWGD